MPFRTGGPARAGAARPKRADSDAVRGPGQGALERPERQGGRRGRAAGRELRQRRLQLPLRVLELAGRAAR